ncbi:MAG: hypothetical protein AAGK21_17690 [Bacteroidota bacterium]
MTPDRWTRIERLFTEAAALPESERAPFLLSRTQADRQLMADVERLLALDADADAYLTGLAGDLVAHLRQRSRLGGPADP